MTQNIRFSIVTKFDRIFVIYPKHFSFRFVIVKASQKSRVYRCEHSKNSLKIIEIKFIYETFSIFCKKKIIIGSH